MGVSSRDLFGRATGAQPAIPGSYGQPPAGYRLPDALTLGPVHLIVSNLDRSVDWYTSVLGMRELAREGDAVRLGATDGSHLVTLESRPGVRPVRAGSRLGLYHFAILLPSRSALGAFIQHLASIGARAGASDHLVSEALYLTDPDGLGIEVYRDRPRSEWQREGAELRMATDPLDFPAVVAAAGDTPWQGMPAGTVMGHLHLHVGDIDLARRFYSDGLGFDRMVWRYPGALFLAAGGYHHHLGTNTWAQGAAPAGDGDARLESWTIHLPAETDLAAARASIANAGFAVDGNVVRDPWGTGVRLAGLQGAAGQTTV